MVPKGNEFLNQLKSYLEEIALHKGEKSLFETVRDKHF